MFGRLSILFFSAIIFILPVCREEKVWDKAGIVVFTRHEDRLPALVRLDGDSIGMLYEVAADTSLYPAYGSEGTVSFMLAPGSYNLYARTSDNPITGIYYFWSFDSDTFCSLAYYITGLCNCVNIHGGKRRVFFSS